ncbi:MAG: hypothetical protein H7840_01015 [Alphaproteobacteria bacterium]
MTKAVGAVVLGMVVGLGLGACERDAALVPSSRSDTAMPSTPSFSQFSDIPVPQNSTMDVKGTLVLGSRDAWVGRLMLAARYGSSEIFDFYHAEMPRFGWEEITSVRSAVSVLTYRRGNRIATIQIQATPLGNSEVDFVVSPQGTSSGVEASGGIAPPAARSAPAPVRGR